MADGRSVYCLPCKREVARRGSAEVEDRSPSRASPGTIAAPAPAPERRRSGPKSKLTPELIEEVVGVLERGHTRRAAAAVAGIEDRTLRGWLADAREEGATSLQRELLAAVERAEGVGEHTLVEMVRASAEIDPNAAKWLLERRHSIDWARKESVTLTNESKPADLQVLRELLTKRIDALIASRVDRGSEGQGRGGDGGTPEGDEASPPLPAPDA
jgi:hypothetical protein